MALKKETSPGVRSSVSKVDNTPTKGVKIARENRSQCNSMLDSEREAYMMDALSIIYGHKAAVRSHRR